MSLENVKVTIEGHGLKLCIFYNDFKLYGDVLSRLELAEMQIQGANHFIYDRIDKFNEFVESYEELVGLGTT